ncbi:MAG TPA: aspartate kinase [Ferruginibacter sp.]|nr:aspartate kinase [Ferruginibacter sp.]HMP21040.1 aspartate kinase [Ferruginibacter sp.]
MKVFKFGGASISSVERIQNVANIIRLYGNEKLFIIISAMGKTTNALENVAEAFFAGKKDEALALFAAIKEQHLQVAEVLTGKAPAGFTDIFTEVEWLLHDEPVREYDYYYDQVVCVGELLSTLIVSEYLQYCGIKNLWLDVRDIVRTDDNFRDAGIDWNFTQQKVNEIVRPAYEKTGIIIAQGFIGATDENESTTLGREGSDYSAAIFANMLDAESQSIWKDVEGVMNADPKLFPDASFISELSYDEVIEMAYYGAQVIHPKTIKPLQNKGIPLHVRCFLKPELKGTIISAKHVAGLPPVIVVKSRQVLMQLTSKDYSFVEDTLIDKWHQWLHTAKIRPNLTQNGAISLLCCVDDNPEKIEKLALQAAVLFDVQLEKDLTLLTIRHYNDAIIQKLTEGHSQLLVQKTKDTIQVLMREGWVI